MRYLLKQRILEKYGSQYRFSKEIDQTPQAVSLVVRGVKTPRGAAMVGWCSVLDIPKSEVPIFFRNEVPEVERMGAT